MHGGYSANKIWRPTWCAAYLVFSRIVGDNVYQWQVQQGLDAATLRQQMANN